MGLNKISEKWKGILLVDWPDIEIPRALLQGGYQVFSFSPEGYSQAVIAKTGLQNAAEVDFSPVDPPSHVDIVVIYRPPEEHAEIIKEMVLPLGAKMVWLQPPVESDETKNSVEELGLDFVQGRDVREIIS